MTLSITKFTGSVLRSSLPYGSILINFPFRTFTINCKSHKSTIKTLSGMLFSDVFAYFCNQFIHTILHFQHVTLRNVTDISYLAVAELLCNTFVQSNTNSLRNEKLRTENHLYGRR